MEKVIEIMWDSVDADDFNEFVKDIKTMFPKAEVVYWESSAFDVVEVPENVTEDWYWETLFNEIIPNEIQKGGYKIHIYVPPETVQTPYGASIFIGC